MARVVFLILVLASFALPGCNMKKDASEKYSTDATEFNRMIDLGFPVKSIKWEVFGTPEDDGGVPGPTDYVTLIAEATAIGTDKNVAAIANGEIWMVPKAARPWLSAEFAAFLDKYKNVPLDPSQVPGCSAIRTRVKTTNKDVEGFICKRAEKVLIYLLLYSEMDDNVSSEN